MSFYQYRNSHNKDKIVSRPGYSYNWKSILERRSLTHFGWVNMHQKTSPVFRHRAIFWTNADFLLIRSLATNFILKFESKYGNNFIHKIHLQMSSEKKKRWPFCFGPNVLYGKETQSEVARSDHKSSFIVNPNKHLNKQTSGWCDITCFCLLLDEVYCCHEPV